MDIIFSFVQQNALLEILQSASTTILTVNIAIAIFLVQESHRLHIDRQIILIQIVQAKKFLISFGLIFVPLLFWNLVSVGGKIVLFIIPITGILIQLGILARAYRWISSFEVPESDTYRMKLRKDFLQHQPKKKIPFWSSIFQETKYISEEITYIQAFINNLNQLLEEEDFETISIYLSELREQINNVSLFEPVIYVNILSKLLELRKFTFIQGKNESIGKIKAHNVITQLLINFTYVGVQKNLTYEFFNTLKYSIKEVNNKEYSKAIVSTVAKPFFESIESTPKGCLPDEWKVTEKNITENHVAGLWNDIFLDWVQDRIHSNENDSDKKLDKVLDVLYPEVIPMTWSIILTFFFRPYYENTQRIRSIIENPPNFGQYTGVIVSWIGDDAEMQNNAEDEWKKKYNKIRNRTLDLALRLFKGHFSENKLQDYIEATEDLQGVYDDESYEEARRKQILQMFKDMQKMRQDDEEQKLESEQDKEENGE